jgi:CheY-like chemotaxis protein
VSLSVSGSRQPAVLVVEDDEVLRDVLTQTLVREGFMVLTAATGHDAIGLLQTPATPIDVVLLDIGLPDVSGADLFARLREFLPYLPVVVCSGAADPEDVKRLRGLGITRFFPKPISTPDLIAALRAAIAPASE